MATCKHCGYEIEDMGPEVGWVETRSGDDGGTYDKCTETWISDEVGHGEHEPENDVRLDPRWRSRPSPE